MLLVPVGEAALPQQASPLPPVQHESIQGPLKPGAGLGHGLLRARHLPVLAEDHHGQGGLHPLLQGVGGRVEPDIPRTPLPALHRPHVQGAFEFVWLQLFLA